MDTVTYPNDRTVRVVTEHLIAVRLQSPLDATAFRRYQVQATPTVLILDQNRTEHQRITGFLLPDEFVPWLLIGVAKAHLGNGRIKYARGAAERLLADHPSSRWGAEAAALKRSCDAHSGGR